MLLVSSTDIANYLYTIHAHDSVGTVLHVVTHVLSVVRCSRVASWKFLSDDWSGSV